MSVSIAMTILIMSIANIYTRIINIMTTILRILNIIITIFYC